MEIGVVVALAIAKFLGYLASKIGDNIVGSMLAALTAKLKAYAIRTDADSIGYALRKISEALQLNSDSYTIRGKFNIGKEVELHVTYEHRNNTTNVIQMTEREIHDRGVDVHKVDRGWTNHFFSNVRNVSDEDMQRFWAKILAGELETPGRTSLRTLSILKDMSQKDAKLFSRVADFIMGGLIFIDDKWTRLVPGFPSSKDFFDLSHLGVLNVMTLLTQCFKGENSYRFYDERRVYFIESQNKQPFSLGFEVHGLTPSGKELLSFVKPDPNHTYLRAFAGYLKEQNSSLIFSYSQITARDGDIISHKKEKVRVEPLAPGEKIKDTCETK